MLRLNNKKKLGVPVLFYISDVFFIIKKEDIEKNLN